MFGSQEGNRYGPFLLQESCLDFTTASLECVRCSMEREDVIAADDEEKGDPSMALECR